MVSDVVLVALIASVPTTIGVVLTYFATRKVQEKVDQVDSKVIENSHRMDGRLDALVALTKELAYAAGAKDEKDRADKGL